LRGSAFKGSGLGKNQHWQPQVFEISAGSRTYCKKKSGLSLAFDYAGASLSDVFGKEGELERETTLNSEPLNL
jgi:hypothetical protein